MYTNNAEQFFSFFIFIIVGVIISFVFDIFRILRKTIKTSDFITYIEDIIFWIISMFIILISIFIFNNGVLRLYIFIGIIAGAIIYLVFISKYIISIGLYCINILKNFFLVLLIPLKYILNLIKKLFFKPISFIIINIRKLTFKIKKILIFDKKT